MYRNTSVQPTNREIFLCLCHSKPSRLFGCYTELDLHIRPLAHPRVLHLTVKQTFDDEGSDRCYCPMSETTLVFFGNDDSIFARSRYETCKPEQDQSSVMRVSSFVSNKQHILNNDNKKKPHLLDCSPVLYKKAFSVARRSSLIISCERKLKMELQNAS